MPAVQSVLATSRLLARRTVAAGDPLGNGDRDAEDVHRPGAVRGHAGRGGEGVGEAGLARRVAAAGELLKRGYG